MSIKIKVVLNEWPAAEDLVSLIPKKIREAADTELLAVAEQAVLDFQIKARSGGFGQRGGGPALVNKGTYVDSWKAEQIAPLSVSLGPTGNNTNMSNAALHEVLEHGTFGMAGIPHLRGIVRWVERVGTKRMSKAIAKAIGG